MIKRWMTLLLIGALLQMLLVVPVEAAPGLQTQTIHTVQPGENLFRISLRYGVTVNAIKAANGLSNDIVYVGQRLIIPAAGAPAPAPTQPAPSTGGLHTVQPGETLSAIALRYGVSSWALVQANHLASVNLIYVGQQLIIPGGAAAPGTPVPAAGTYTVRPGDSLSSIAARFGTTVAALAAQNGITNPELIYVGQVLRLSGNTITPATGGARHIYIYLSQQHLYAYEGDRLVYSFVVSSGRAPTYTRTGDFRVQSKVPNAWGSTWNIWMPHWLGIYWSGGLENGIHALPVLPSGQTLWAGYLGTPVSFGCIVLGTYEAQQLYQWAEIGTPVTIRY
ncbi:MAG: LysM peptidoglycan-binding domain-containing protein [Anaerolineae bacterium]|nr:LysM peptidoglycan-binding domain-containing protein [Anaerolineae bacterium]